MKTLNLIKILSVYLLLTALPCLFLLIVALYSQEINTFRDGVSVTVPGVIVILTIVNGIYILSGRKDISYFRGAIINGGILALQIPTIAIDGFIFRYIQGVEWLFFIHYNQLSQKLVWGNYFDRLLIDYNLKFDSSENILLGINVIGLILAISSFWLAYRIKKQSKKSLPLDRWIQLSSYSGSEGGVYIGVYAYHEGGVCSYTYGMGCS